MIALKGSTLYHIYFFIISLKNKLLKSVVKAVFFIIIQEHINVSISVVAETNEQLLGEYIQANTWLAKTTIKCYHLVRKGKHLTAEYYIISGTFIGINLLIYHLPLQSRNIITKTSYITFLFQALYKYTKYHIHRISFLLM